MHAATACAHPGVRAAAPTCTATVTATAASPIPKGSFSMRITHTHFVVPAIAVGALLLSGCGGSDEPTTATTSSATSNPASSAATKGSSADIAFATGMIPHHGQAVEMADLALTKASSPKIKALAEKVKAAQAPEITTLSDLLNGWGEPVPATTGHSGSMAGMEHGDSSMMTSEQMDDLDAATGPMFDRMWVNMMITHHEGAVAMAETEIREGTDAEAAQLAQTIADAQTKEIADLQSLRTELS